jgi:hypothetical protein
MPGTTFRDKEEDCPMTNVVALREQDEARERAIRLAARFGFNPQQLQDAIKPLFLLMHRGGIGCISVTRDGGRAVVEIDGERF